MAPLETDSKPYTQEASAEAEPENELDSAAELQFLRAKVAELTASEHKLRVQNLALRTRLERLQSGQSFERKLHLALGLSLCLLFTFAAGLVSIILANH
jgi:hypothetical protein